MFIALIQKGLVPFSLTIEIIDDGFYPEENEEFYSIGKGQHNTYNNK